MCPARPQTSPNPRSGSVAFSDCSSRTPSVTGGGARTPEGRLRPPAVFSQPVSAATWPLLRPPLRLRGGGASRSRYLKDTQGRWKTAGPGGRGGWRAYHSMMMRRQRLPWCMFSYTSRMRTMWGPPEACQWWSTSCRALGLSYRSWGPVVIESVRLTAATQIVPLPSLCRERHVNSERPVTCRGRAHRKGQNGDSNPGFPDLRSSKPWDLIKGQPQTACLEARKALGGG